MIHIGLFEGIGGFSLAAKWAGWETYVTCEIADFQRVVLEHHYPQAYHHKDIHDLTYSLIDEELTKRRGEDWRADDIVLTGGFPCFVVGTKVMTENGYKSIESLSVGEKVLTLEGDYKPINAIMHRDNAVTLKIRPQGVHDFIETTQEHPFLVKKKEHPRARKKKNRYTEPKWVCAKDIKKGDLVGYRSINGSLDLFDKYFWYLVGRYLGDGWIQHQKRTSNTPQGNRGSRVKSRVWKVIICANKNDNSISEAIEKAGYNYTLSEERTVNKYIISNKDLVKFLDSFGKYAHGKHLDPMCFQLKDDYKKELFKGWLDSDGYVDGKAYKVTTVSESLAYDMAQIARDAYKCIVNIHKKKVPPTTVIEGREVSQRPQFCVTVTNTERYGFYEDGFIWSPVRKIEKGGISRVYNIGVHESETYTVSGITVHNCQPFSVAGEQKGKDDPRHLWPEMLRTIREIKPKWIVGENVYGIVNWSDGLVFEEVQADLEAEGYEVQAYVIPAAGVGAPHRRNRVWFIAYTDLVYEGRDSRENEKEDGRSGVQERDEVHKLISTDEVRKLFTNPNKERLQRLEEHRSLKEQRQDEVELSTRLFRTEWEDFPVEPPLRYGNDGLPEGLHGITVSKWANETIKAAGNAVVPHIPYQIFKAINDFPHFYRAYL